MNFTDFTLIEVYGLFDTVNEYTRNHYIKNYLRKMVEFTKSEEWEYLIIVIDKLIEWYENEIEIIREDKYIYNTSDHEKSFNLLKEMKKLLNEREK